MKRIIPLLFAVSTSTLAHAAPAPAPAPVKKADAAEASLANAAAASKAAADAKAVAAAKFTNELAASTLLDESAQAYAKLKGLSMRYMAHDQSNGKSSSTNGVIAFERPGKTKIEIKTGEEKYLILSDGEKIFTQVRPQDYRVSYPGGDPLETLGNVPSALSILLPALVEGNNPLGLEQMKWLDVKPLPDNGVTMSARLAPGAPPLVFRLYFDPTDKLLRRVEAEMTLKGTKSLNLTTLSDLKINPDFAADSFNFTPPVGAKAVVEPPKFDPRLKVGAAPFELTGEDITGKKHPWSEYAGKVVLLNFWATWCEPCLREMPNILQNYKNYREDGFEILNVSLDEDREQLLAFIKANKFSFPQILDTREGQHPDATLYGVTAIPFALLIGKDGKIAAVNPHGKLLEPAIVKALAG